MERNDFPIPGIAAVLSFVFTGLGQIYNGQITKGLILMAVSAINILVFIVGAVVVANSFFERVGNWPSNIIAGSILIILSILIIIIAGTYSIFDAYHTTRKK